MQNRMIPKSTVIPELVYSDIGEAIRWLCDAFGFTLRIRIADHRAQLNVGDGAVVLMESRPDVKGPSSVMVRVEDADAHCARAREHGAQITQEPTTFPYGERQYTAVDLGGHRWHFSQSVADVHPSQFGFEVGDL
jgi:uncharacterized glyoxalase superfamily protein PhnB